ncbi:TRAP transporter substrate-binding protein [Ornithinimicrobium sufpigmenti]|uniref:TRAP transporter substrate-binding protein n=1 Tax=Ornithinimicrobium sufpigmenti TaxID=2508882 RepID=UPI0010357E7B|nr:MULTISPECIES: TRAP transporter substrate-binding protein [unclassified Ornithinimicrobium]
MRITPAGGAFALAAALTLTLSACGGETAAGGQDRAILRLALNQAEGHPSYVALQNFSDRLEERTDGRVFIDVYANETLGAQAEALQLVSDDIIALAIVSGTQLENLHPDFVVFNMPRVFDDVEHQLTVVNDPAIVGDLYTSLEDSENFTVLGGLTQGSRHLYTSRPVTEPADMAGLKIRVQESPLHLAMINAMGGSATPMAYGEVYTAMQSGVLDGAENNEVSYVTQKHFEVAPHLSLTNHLVGLDYLIINSDTLDGLEQQDEQAFLEEWEAAYLEHAELWAEATEEAVEEARAGGAQIHEVDDQAFTQALEPLQERFLTTPAQQALFDAARAAAEE